ncbi:MAG TPA: hypothetical protein VK438_13040 [Xanthobacteraceae bacterium]|nr:hypothetical protein [Xanthobacteraceae bacterium]
MRLRFALAALAAASALSATATGRAVAAEQGACLSADERRAVLAEHRAVPLARVLHLVKSKVFGEVLRARLCRPDAGKGLVYVLTVLARNGKVLQARVDAADGHWLGAS